jgi:pimeloyl-ACP methyl ester carboxylesterase
VIHYHRRGYAQSSPVQGAGSIERDAADGRALLAALGVARAHVVGVSYSGGRPAAGGRLADWVHSLALLEPPPVLLLVPVHTDGGQAASGAAWRRDGGALAELGAMAADGLRFELRTAGSFGPSQPLATLTAGQPLPAEQTEALQFNPWTTGPGIRPHGWLNLLRDTAYRASQRGRRR